MPRPRILPSDRALERMVESGMTQQQIADAVAAETGHPVSRTTVAVALHRAGMSKPLPRYADEVPWRVAEDHQTQYPLRMLRLLGRRRAGGDLSPSDARRLDSWLATLEEQGAVVGYSEERGVLYVPARPGIDGVDGIPVRRQVLTEEQFV